MTEKERVNEEWKERTARCWGVRRKKETWVTAIMCRLGIHDYSWYQRLSGLYNCWVCSYCLDERVSL